ncbi:DedA family protein [Salinisphaera sp. Q1T1-3]|uniref:DedA family protein n=1 Tax=Salinisphaera sp. Q1T1-3 TaxID=2321229 RepID=UPI000E7454C3|nr:DedA family protein [Salinisphaera sp. Q1T1-3]RJS92551.1 DedA family protein [Salinisphaera sp. Q1T1-3]
MIATLSDLIANYGYFAVAIGCFFEGEAAVLLGMMAATKGMLSPHGVWFAATIGTIIGDNIWFHIGHHMGQPALARRPKWHARATRVEALLGRYGPLIMIGFRFLYAMRSVTPFVLGSLGVSPWRFLFYDVIGTLIWSTSVTVVAWYLADGISRALSKIQNAEQLMLIAVLVLAFGGWLIYYTRQRWRR